MKRLRGILMLIGLGFVLAISGNALADTGGPDDFGYTYTDNGESTVTYEWIDISGMSPVSLTLGDDDESTAIDMTFPFTFYGVPYNTIYIHANGFVKFDAEVYDLFMGYQCPLPVSDEVNGMIAFYYRDFNPGETAGGTIRYAIDTASDPDRFIVEFADVPICCSSYTPPPDPDPVTVQLVLYANNEIQVNVQDSSPNEGGDATIGVEAPGAISGLSYRGCLLTGSVVANTAVRFYPPTGGTPVVPRTTKHWGRPGDTLAYDYTVFNLGTADVTFTIAESGSAWSPVLSATSLPLAAGTSSPFTVDVTIPAAAADGAHDVSTVTFTPDTGAPVTINAIALVQTEAADTFWQELPDVPVAVENAAAAADGNYIFVMGGWTTDPLNPEVPVYEDTVHRYDVTTNTWVTEGIEPMPQPRAGAAACGMDGKVYVVGGYGETGGVAQMAWDLFIYDVATNAWDLGAAMLSGRTDHAAVCDANNGKLYTMGGVRNTTDTTPENGELANDIIIYDVATEAWTAATGTMNYYRIYFVAGMPDDETIIVAGNDTTASRAFRTEAYSITDDAWTPLDDMTSVRQAPVAGVLESGRFCVGSGYNPALNPNFDDTYECFDNSYWIPQLSFLNVPRIYGTSTTHNSQIYAIAGRWYNEDVDPAVYEMTASFERYPHSAIPDAQPDEAVEPVPDADAAEDVPIADIRPDQDAVTDVRVDDVAEEEGEEPEEGGCGCEIIG